MKSHFYNTRLSGNPIPEEDTLGSASESSCSSLGNDHSFTYPPDLLGTSWGSYLFSVPPTAARSSRKVVINATPQTLKLPPISAPSTDQESPKRSILRTPVINDARTVLGRASRPARVEQAGEGQPHPLLQGLQSLVNVAAKTKEKISHSGIDSAPLSTLCETLVSSQYDLRQNLVDRLSAEDRDTETSGSTCSSVDSVGLLQLVFKCLEATLQSLAEQGEKLKEKSEFLQQTGKHLNRSQRDFMREQNALQQAVETARTQLTIEQQALEEKRETLALAEEEMRKWTEEHEHTRRRQGKGGGGAGRGGGGSKAAPKPTHFVTGSVQGHSQKVTVSHTQKEQARLEKLLLQQEKELRSLQEAHHTTKAELFTIQEHAERLQHKLENSIIEARRSEATLSYQVQLARTAQEMNFQNKATSKTTQSDRIFANVSGISTAHKALSREIDRVQRQLREQQKRGEQLQQQLKASSQKLRQTGSSVRYQYRDTAAGPGYSGEWRKRKQLNPEHSKPFTLPKIPGVHTRKKLPSYCFSRSELVTLARFDDPETAEQVLEWLGQQGKLD